MSAGRLPQGKSGRVGQPPISGTRARKLSCKGTVRSNLELPPGSLMHASMMLNRS